METVIPISSLSSRENIPALANDSQTKIRPESFGQRRRDPSEIVWRWLPDGPWKVNDKLDPNFHEALALDWQSRYGGDIHQKRSDVMDHFMNNPAKLSSKWEWYQTKYLHKAANVHLRKLGGIDTTDDEQQIIKHAGAFRDLPEDLRVTATRTSEEIIAEVAPHALPMVQQVNEQRSLAPEGAEDAQAYTRTASAEDAEFWKEQARKFAENAIAKKKQKARYKGKPEEDALSDAQTVLEDMRKLLKYGTLAMREEAIAWANNPINGCILIERNGQAVDIQELEF